MIIKTTCLPRDNIAHTCDRRYLFDNDFVWATPSAISIQKTVTVEIGKLFESNFTDNTVCFAMLSHIFYIYRRRPTY